MNEHIRVEGVVGRRGHEAGQTWVKKNPHRAEIKRLEDFMAEATRRPGGLANWDSAFCTGAGANEVYSGAERFAFLLFPEYEGDRQFAQAFWGSIGADGLPSDEFVQGFAYGALYARSFEVTGE